MKNNIYLLIIVLVLISGLSSCMKDKGDLVDIDQCDTTDYYLNIRPIIQTHCMGNNAGCHITGGSGNGDFSDYYNLKEKIDESSFESRVIIKKEMPPTPSPLPALSDADRTILETWVNNGAVGCNNN